MRLPPLTTRKPLPAATPAAPAPSTPPSLLSREPLLLTAFLLAVFYFGRPLLIPLAFAVTLAFLLSPLISRLQRLRLHRTPATLLVIAGATALLSTVLWLVAGQLLTVVNDLPSHAPNIRAKLAKTHIPANSSLGQAVVSMEGLSREFAASPTEAESQESPESLEARHRAVGARARAAARRAAAAHPELPQPTPVVVVPAPPSGFASLGALARPVVGPLATAGMVLIFTVYMLLKQQDLRNRLLLLAGIGRLQLVSHALDDAAARISRYLVANVAVNAGFGVVFAAALYAIGIPYATLWGALLALMRTIPYLGPVVGGGLPALFALVYFPTWWQGLCTLAFIALLEILVSNFLEPWLYGSHTGISELALLVMAVVWTLLWGWPGLALSAPLTVCLIVAGRTMPQMSFLHILLGDDAQLAPEARFYERMLALDQAEARGLAERFLAQAPAKPSFSRSLRRTEKTMPAAPPAARSTLDLYELLLLPALALAEQDRHRGFLPEPQAAYILQSFAELIAELTSFTVQTPATAASAFPLADDAAQHTRPLGCPVLCIPALDQADEIAATMLAQALEAAGHKTILLPPTALSPELLSRLAQDPTTTFCISALPPFAFTSARQLYNRLRSALPNNPITIALWRSSTTPHLLATRLGISSADSSANLSQVATTLAGVLATIPAPTAPVAEPSPLAYTL